MPWVQKVSLQRVRIRGSLGILWGDQEEQEVQVGKRANAESQDVLRRHFEDCAVALALSRTRSSTPLRCVPALDRRDRVIFSPGSVVH